MRLHGVYGKALGPGSLQSCSCFAVETIGAEAQDAFDIQLAQRSRVQGVVEVSEVEVSADPRWLVWDRLQSSATGLPRVAVLSSASVSNSKQR